MVLQLRTADWHIASKCTRPLKVLQALLETPDDPSVKGILDASTPMSAVVATAVLEQHTTLVMAEFFSRGFARWTQTAWVMQALGAPLHAAWQVDFDAAAHDMLACQQPSASFVDHPEDLAAAF